MSHHEVEIQKILFREILKFFNKNFKRENFLISFSKTKLHENKITKTLNDYVPDHFAFLRYGTKSACTLESRFKNEY